MHYDLRILCFLLVLLNLVGNFAKFASGQNLPTRPIIKDKAITQKELNQFYSKVSDKIDFVTDEIARLEKKIPDGLITDLQDIKNNINDLKTSNDALLKLTNGNSKDLIKLNQKLDTEIKALKDQIVDQNTMKRDIITELTSHFDKLFQTKLDQKMEEANKKFEKEMKKLDLIIDDFNTTIINSLITGGPNIGNGKVNRLPVWLDIDYQINVTNPCKPNPCLHGGSCVLESSQHDFQCQLCPFPMGGKICQSLACEDRCFRLKDTVYFVHSDRSMNWDDANNKCNAKGTSLALIQDGAAHQFVRKQLETFYKDEPLTFWIGLQRASSSDKWSWLDGTQFDANYNGWFASSGSGNCVGVTKSNGAYNLNAEPCDGAPNRKYYPLCQRKYSFLS